MSHRDVNKYFHFKDLVTKMAEPGSTVTTLNAIVSQNSVVLAEVPSS